MHSTTPTLTYFATVQNQNGTERRIAISLPYIACIADDPHYAAPPAAARARAAGHTRPSRWSNKLIRRTMSRDRESPAQMRNRVAYEATMRRIDRGGV